MNIYQKDFPVLSTEVDMYRRLRLSTLFTILQEAAITHVKELGAGSEKTLDRGLLWVVTQQSAKIYRMPEYDEMLSLRSWPGKTRHLFFPRYTQILDVSGQVLIEAASFWVLMDQRTRSVIFPEKYGIMIEGAETAAGIPLPKRIRAGEIEKEAVFTVPYSYLDLNGHMNNARYFDLAMDYLPSEIRRKKVSEISTEYIGEAKLGDRITLKYGKTDGCYYLSGETEKPIFRMKLTVV